ncbi:tRNA threonylcarbamoyladenosine dehydratase [bacterium]|nr:tRNA threonylcarbamoyladenosine dehydratase [bacterium]
MNIKTFERNSLFWGENNQKILSTKNVAVFGLGGVGGFCAEALARTGIGNLTIIDFDTVSQSNINRQIIALNSTIGEKKTALFEKRLKDINPEINIKIIDDFYNDEELAIDFSKEKYDYVADAIDTMRSKIHLINSCYQNNIPIICSMGAGNRIDPTQLYISDLKDIENKNAPFVSNVIYQLKKLGITEGITVVTSREKPFVQEKLSELEQITTKNGLEIEFNKITPSSTPFVASTAGIYMAYYIVQSFLKDYK